MNNSYRLLLLLFALATLCISLRPAASNAAVVRLGDKFRVNVQSSRDQQYPQVVTLGTGEFVVVWSGANSEDPFRPPVIGRTFDASGLPVTLEFILPDVLGERSIIAKNESFIVSWRGPEFAQISPHGIIETSRQLEGESLGAPALALSPLGDTIVVWDPPGIVAQRFDPDLQSTGVPLLIGRGEAGDEYPHAPTVATLEDGSFVVAWWAEASSALWGQIVDPTDGLVGHPFAIVPPAELADLSDSPQICARSDGGFVVAWNDDDHPTEFRSYPSGTAPPSDRLCSGLGSHMALSCLYGPHFLLLGLAGDGIAGRIVDRTNRVIGECQVPVPSVQDTDLFPVPAAAPLDDDTFVVVWGECAEGAQDGCNVFAQRFRITQAARCSGDCNGDGAVSVDEIILGVHLALSGDRNDAEICPQLDSDLDCQVSVDELIQAVDRALAGCN